jgi:Cu(I)/Ag(I) efflux system membrane fusion protein
VVDNPDQRLRPGQYGDLIFDVAGRESLVVPRDAVVDTGEHQYVFLDRGGGRLEPRRVRVGGLFGEQREILEGLSAGDVVVTRGAFLIDSESRLAASIEQAPAPARAAGNGGGGSEASGPDCETAFDRAGHADAYRQCRECERVHAGMGSMVADCKNAIARPWR